MPVCAAGHDSETTDFCDVCGTPLDEVSTPLAARQPVTVPVDPCPSCGTARTGRFCEVCGHDHTRPLPPPVPQVSPEPTRSTPDHSTPEHPTYATSGQSASPRPATAHQVSAEPAVDPGQPGQRPAAQAVLVESGPEREAPARPAPAPTPVPPSAPDPDRGDATPPAGNWTAIVAADPDYYRQVIAANGPDAASIVLPEYCPERRFVLTGAQVRIGRRSVSRGLNPEIDLSGPPEDPGVSHLHAVLLARPGGGWSVLDPGSTNGTTINGAADPIAENVAVPLSDGDRVHVGAWTTITLHTP